MSTAVAEKPSAANGAAKSQAQSTPQASAAPAPLWSGRRIPIILLSGEVNSGKTLFPLLIDPACRTPDHEPTTIVWDQEGSAEPYCGGLNFKWEDVRAAVMDGLHMKVGKATDKDPRWRKMLLEDTKGINDFPSTSLFRAWYMSLLEIPRGRYRVGSVDTFTPIQEGLIEWLKTHPLAFGRTAQQYDKASSMFLWPDVKAMLSHILSVDCRLRFETFCMTVHLKNEWRTGAKTGNRIAEGLDVLDKLATLHIRLDRTAESKKKSAPRLPFGIVVKQRFVEFGENETDDGDRPILPPRLPEATPKAIRDYIASPPDFANLKPEERMPDDAMSEDDKLRLRAYASENDRATAEANLSLQEKMLAAAQAQVAARGGQAGGQAQAAQAAAAADRVDAETLDRLKAIATDRFASPIALASGHTIDFPSWAGEKVRTFGIASLREMTREQAAEFERDLLEIIATQGFPSSEVATTPASDDVPFDTAEQAAGQPSTAGPMTDVQVMTIKSLLPIVDALTGGNTPSAVIPILAEFGASKIPELNAATATQFLDKLQHLITTLEMQQQLAGGAVAAEVDVDSAPQAGQPADASSSATSADPLDEPGSITNETLSSLKDWATKTGWTKFEDHQAWLKPFGIVNFRGLSQRQAEARIAELQQVSDGFGGGTPKN